jgi:hypothetical protein
VEVLTDSKQSPPLMTYSAGDHSGGKWSSVYSKPMKSRSGHGSSVLKNTSGTLSTIDQNTVDG